MSERLVSFSEVQKLNENIEVKASRFLIAGLGAFATKDIKKNETVCYYMGSLIDAQEAETDEYTVQFSADRLISPSKPFLDNNRFTKEPLCKAAFINDPRGTEQVKNVVFVDRSYARVVPDEEARSSPQKISPPKKKSKSDEESLVFALKINAVTDIRVGDELLLDYGYKSYWKEPTKKKTTKSVSEEKPFRFFHFSKINTQGIESLLKKKKWDQVERPSLESLESTIRSWPDDQYGIRTTTIQNKLLELGPEAFLKLSMADESWRDLLKQLYEDQEIEDAIVKSLFASSATGALYRAEESQLRQSMDSIVSLLLDLHDSVFFSSLKDADERKSRFGQALKTFLQNDIPKERSAKVFFFLSILKSDILPLVEENKQDFEFFRDVKAKELFNDVKRYIVADVNTIFEEFISTDKLSSLSNMTEVVEKFFDFLVRWKRDGRPLPQPKNASESSPLPKTPRRTTRSSLQKAMEEKKENLP